MAQALVNIKVHDTVNHFMTIIHIPDTSSQQLEDFVGAMFYRLHALTDGN